MRFLTTGDWHVDAVTAGYRRAGDVERAAMATAELAVREGVDLYCFNGDLCDPDLSAVGTIRGIALSLKIARFLGQNGIPNFWISGNHDVLEDGTGNTTLTPLAEAKLDKTVVFEEPGALTVPNRGGVEGGFLFCALPFVARSRAYDPHAVVKGFGERSRGTDTFHVVLGHLQVEGALLGSETLDMPRGRDVRFPVEAVKLLPRRFCLNGHYHKRQQVGEVFMPGSLERLSFGEEQNQPGCAIVEV